MEKGLKHPSKFPACTVPWHVTVTFRLSSYRRQGGLHMVGRRNGRSYDCVVLDLNTQCDFCRSDGASPVLNIQDVVPALRRIVAWTKRNGVPVVSTIDSHRLSELPDHGQPVHCVDGSPGQRKVEFTVFPLRERVEFDNTLSVPLDLFKRCQQVIFRQRGEDLLNNPKADRFLTQIAASDFVVFGNTIEGAVKHLALGLVAREKQVTVVVDACGYWDRVAADQTLRQLDAKGVHLITMDELSGRQLASRRRYRVVVRRREPMPEVESASVGNGHKSTATSARRNGRTRIQTNGHSRIAQAAKNGRAKK